MSSSSRGGASDAAGSRWLALQQRASQLKYNTKLDGYETSVTEAQLRDAPAFSDDSWSDRNWETKTHSYYNAPPYW